MMFRVLIRLLSGLAIALVFLGLPRRSHAQSAPPIHPRQLALPVRTFPARPQGHTLPAGAQSPLRLQPGSSAGQQAVYEQIVRWRSHSIPLTLRYRATLFASAVAADAAAADATASLWELGHPAPSGGLAIFRLEEGRTQAEIAVVIRAGAAEAEIRLHGPSRDLSHGVPVLHRVARTARSVLTSLPPAPPAAPPPLPLYVAPPGTGPMVESPSLLSLTGPADSGAFRSGSPALAALAHPSGMLRPAGSLSSFDRIIPGDLGWYGNTSLYAGSNAAVTAFQTLVQTNDRQWHRVAVPAISSLADVVAGWKRPDETAIAVRSGNLILVLASGTGQIAAESSAAASIMAQMPTRLHAQGTSIVDATGRPARLTGINWYGAESPDFVVGGLDARPYGDILRTLQGLGYNTLRLPFSNQLVEQNPIVTQHLAANPDLAGLHALDILDRIIAYAGALGMRVILDNHRSDAGWSSEPLWYTDQYPESAFIHDWQVMAARYAASDAVVGMDLRNEPHGPATWGGDPSTDWHGAAESAGNAILAVNPTVLILVEGVQFSPGDPSGWWGGNLTGVAANPIVLTYPDGSSARDKLVYSPHEYGPLMCGGGCPWFNATTTPQSLTAVWDHYWGYIAADPAQPYAAPLWIGEFGTCNNAPTCVADSTPGSQGQWFSSLLTYMQQRGIDGAYWAANGTQSSGDTRQYGAPEGYGLLNPDWATPHAVVQAAMTPLLTQ